MSFGSELKDQFSTVNQFVSGGIQFLNEVREFIKERAQIEKEYAGKIEALARKYLLKKEKKEVSMSVGSANSLSERDFNNAKSEPSTFVKAWTTLLEETENIARERSKFSESLSTNLTEQIKAVATKKEEIRKKHASFHQQLTSDRDKAKSRYDEACVETQASQQKQERAPDERLLEKLRKQASENAIDMNNNKNSYILSIRIANKHKSKYQNADVPALLDQLQELNESKTTALKRIWNEYVDLDQSMLNDSKLHLEMMSEAIRNIDVRIDSRIFLTYNKKKWNEAPDFKFESSLAFKEDDEMVDSGNTRVFLSNKLLKSKQKLPELISEIELKRKEIDGLESLKYAYENNPKHGDPDDVTDKLHEAIRKFTILENTLTTYQTEVDNIVEFIGECGYNCHVKCEMKVPPNCTKMRGSIKRGTMYDAAGEISPRGTRFGNNNHRSGRSSSPVHSSSTNDQEVVDETWSATVLYDHVADSSSELSVSSGDIITVIEQDGNAISHNQYDGSGWVMATYNGRSGLVPATYIEYISSGDYVRVLYDYDAQSPEELTIKEGDVIEVTDRDVGNGWWEGTLNGVRGQFPASYVTPAE
ncbi:11876_t:CDS:10 [Acaulospora colombiana]|uniref:11876_t:CDS:1 n=1 Tax=Acaulospora colombiana TaxID=27376 RepID=A0ACA9L0L1_9GLOM|nr:11876_t:CDS:10 [Acaulospora colombiana]